MSGFSMNRLLGVVIAVVSVAIAMIMLTIVTPNINTILDRTTLALYHSGTAGIIQLIPLILVVGIMGMAGYIGFGSVTGRGKFGSGVGIGNIIGIVFAFVILVVGLVVFPIILDTIVDLNQPSEGLDSFAGVLPLLNIVPLVYTVGLLALAGGTVYFGTNSR